MVHDWNNSCCSHFNFILRILSIVIAIMYALEHDTRLGNKITYTRERLYALRRSHVSCMTKMDCSVTRPSPDVLTDLSHSGLLHYRGCRGGRKVRRPIRVNSLSVSRRPTRYSRSTHQHAIDRSNLTLCPITSTPSYTKDNDTNRMFSICSIQPVWQSRLGPAITKTRHRKNRKKHRDKQRYEH